MDSMNLIVDEMAQDSRLNVVAVLSPEHGFRGDKQAETGDPLFYIDKPTGLPVFSAYNMTTQQLTLVLKDMNIEAIVVDMQDVGVRLYTFVWTMYEVMDAVSILHKANSSSDIRVVITDRPNPLGGELVDGPLVNMTCCSSGYGRLPIPFLHGMTIGELGLLFNGVLGIPTENVIVVKAQNWERSMVWTTFGEAGSAPVFPPWIPPSPNLPTVMSAHTYGATVFLEATTAAEGRGTTTPFTMFGAPFLDAEVRVVGCLVVVLHMNLLLIGNCVCILCCHILLAGLRGATEWNLQLRRAREKAGGGRSLSGQRVPRGLLPAHLV